VELIIFEVSNPLSSHTSILKVTFQLPCLTLRDKTIIDYRKVTVMSLDDVIWQIK